MKCIYCNNESDLTVSDIIPYALTGAKLKKRFVCKEHNGFTNDNYENQMENSAYMYCHTLTRGRYFRLYNNGSDG